MPPFASRGRFSRPPLTDDPLWFKDAILYELRIPSFNDSNADGIGDLPGLTQKLDYLEDLGVTALWLLPFYPSPGRDDGYDIANYTEVNPDYGTLDDFKGFLEAAHRRGLRVITELVINHTSDQHPWFQRARRSPAGSELRDFYVWSDTAERFREARIIFKDFETSNWTWDPEAKAYFWHRFYSHQPDLNFRNPAVEKAVFEVCDFWLDMGVDGMRLDAIPYLYEAEGTNSENLPETHAYLKRLRAHIDGKYRNRVLLAEANQWPEEAAAYFGAGDECHMNFHFPSMPRIFMSLHMEDRLPIIDILAQTPAIPDNCQWALFLRNHDELTLEMVTDEERDYMYRAFAQDPSMRINLGIRRRLAPLLRNERPTIELVNALLFSLPGTPVVYYGDELGMGDNVYLGDRNGVRTPMQWSADRNAGFSRANPQRLTLPVVIDPAYHYETINVEAQENDGHSLLWWTKRIVALRKRHPVFGRGTIEFLRPENPKILAFLRRTAEETVLVVANLSRQVQFAALDLSALQGLVPTELFGGTPFPPIGATPYLITLPAHMFYWFAVAPPLLTAGRARAAAYQAIDLETAEPAALFEAAQAEPLADLLSGYLASRHWLPAGVTVQGTSLAAAPLALGADLWLAPVAAQDRDGEPLVYRLLLGLRAGEAAQAVRQLSPQAIIAELRLPADQSGVAGTVLVDALADGSAGPALLSLFGDSPRAGRPSGQLQVERFGPPPELRPKSASKFSPDAGPEAGPEPAADGAGQPRVRAPRSSEDPQQTMLVFGDSLLLRFRHRVEEGLTPDYEITRELNGSGAPVPRLLAALLWQSRRGGSRVMATLQEHFAPEVSGHTFARGELARFFERALTRAREESLPTAPLGSHLALAVSDPPPLLAETMGPFLHWARVLGERLAEMHLALAASGAPAFAPEPYGTLDQRSTYQSMRNLTAQVVRQLRESVSEFPAELRPLAQEVVAAEGQLYRRFERLLSPKLFGKRLRFHGDLDLDHLLFVGNDFRFVDFDGDDRRPLPERRRKRSPLRDLAALIVAIFELASGAVADETLVRPGDRQRAGDWTELWQLAARGALVQAYLFTGAQGSYLPTDPRELELMLDVLVLERTLQQLSRALPASSDDLAIRLRGVLAMLANNGPTA